jgi:hypothetical protein
MSANVFTRNYTVNRHTMEVKNLFDATTFRETLDRIDKLNPGSQRLWGKMNVSQMLAHCKQAFKVPLSNTPMPRAFIGRLLGWVVKKKLYDDSPWKQNLPTAPDFRIKDERDFDTEKRELLELIHQFHDRGPTGTGKYPHPMFGAFTAEQWGKSMWKHLDHHLRQFGV